MTFFPQTHPQQRAQRVQFGSTIPVVIKLNDGRSARAKLQTISETGGMLRLARALEQGNLIEVAFETESGAVKGMAEILEPTRKSNDRVPDGVLQPFRFIALEDDDQRNLRSVLDSRMDRDFLGLRSSQWVAPKRK
jgi:c-di-GMP-binding flagellar brake protein YcgR